MYDGFEPAYPAFISYAPLSRINVLFIVSSASTKSVNEISQNFPVHGNPVNIHKFHKTRTLRLSLPLPWHVSYISFSVSPHGKERNEDNSRLSSSRLKLNVCSASRFVMKTGFRCRIG